MDPLTAIGLASNIIGFVDFAGKLISQGYEIYKSASGTTKENEDIEALIEDLSFHLDELGKGENAVPAAAVTPQDFRDQKLRELAAKCATFAEEILTSLEKLKKEPNAKFKGFNSFGKALRSAWGKKGMEEKVAKLEKFRSELEFTILVLLR